MLSQKTAWTKEEFDEAWQELDMLAQPLLILLARHPGGYRIDELAKRFSTKPQRVRGILGQVNRWHKQHRDKPRLFQSDRRGHLFTMDMGVAALVGEQDDRWVPLG